MGGFAMNRPGLRVGLARPVSLPRCTRRFSAVRAAQTITRPVTYEKLPGESHKYLVNYVGGFNPKFKKRLLCIDGGGVRGLVPATVLLTVEQVLAEYILENYKGKILELLLEVWGGNDYLQQVLSMGSSMNATGSVSMHPSLTQCLCAFHSDHLPPDMTAKNMEVDVADYFDIISGTSVGSIVALYMGTKGGQSEKLLKEIGSNARPGSAQGIVDIIYYRAGMVFPSPM